MDQSWKQEEGTRQYRVFIQHFTHTKFQREKLQERKEVVVTAPVHRLKLAAIAAGCPKTAKTLITGSYTTEKKFYELPEDQTVRNWTQWIVMPIYDFKS